MGTITSGTWNGTTIGTAYGGTGNTSYTANRLVWTESATKFTAGYHYADSTHVGICLTTTPSYNFAVGGTSYFNGNTTHNGIDYFANGTTYYINNSGTANLYGLTTNSTATIKSTLRINNAKNDTVIHCRCNNNTADSGYFGFVRSNPGDGDLYYNTRFRALYYSYNSSTKAKLSTYECYDYPNVSADLAENKTYSILTTKNTVTVG